MINQAPEVTDTRMPDLDWFVENREALEAQYGGRLLGIKDGRVVAQAETAAQLREELRSLGMDRVLVTRANADAWRSHK